MTDETETFFSAGSRYKRNKETGKVERMPDETRGINLETWNNQAKYVADLEDMLKRLQWAGTAWAMGVGCPQCPICGGWPEGASLHTGAGSYEHGRGHRPDCGLAKLLNERNEGD